MKRHAAVVLGKSRVDDHDVGVLGRRELESVRRLTGAPDHLQPVTDTEKAGQAFADPVVGDRRG